MEAVLTTADTFAITLLIQFTAHPFQQNLIPDFQCKSAKEPRFFLWESPVLGQKRLTYFQYNTIAFNGADNDKRTEFSSIKRSFSK